LKKPIVLRIFKNDQLLGVKQFLVPQIVIGRAAPDAEVQVGLEGESVSFIHASIEERDDGNFYVSDLGSVGGTLKNGQAVLDGAIESGDTLQIGDYKIEFFVGAPKPKTGQTGAIPVASLTTAPAVPLTPAQAAPPAVTPPPITTPPVAAPPPFSPPSVTPSVTPPVTTAPVAPKPPATPTPIPTSTPVTPPVAAPPPKATPPAVASPPPPMKVVPPITVVPPAKPSVPTSPGIPNAPTPPKANLQMPPPMKTPGAPTMSAGAGGAGLNMVGPKAGGRAPIGGRKSHERGKKRKTFAPPSKYTDVSQFVKPSKGTVVEVLVVWRERVISNSHFSTTQTVTIGSHPDNNIVIPLLSSKVRKQPILKIDKQAVVLVTGEMRGEVVRGQTSSSFTELMRQNRLAKAGAGYTLALDQGEMAKIELSDQVSVLIRYVGDSPKPVVAPLLDLTASETTGVVLALALVLTLWIYMQIHAPPRELPTDANEPLRTALIVLTPPTPVPLPPPPPPEQVKVTEPPPTPAPQVVKVKVAEKTVQANKAKPTATNLTKKEDPGKSANAAPKNKTGPRALTSPKQGGSIKTAAKESAQMQSKPAKDVTKSGIFSVFGNQGQQDQLAQGTTGSGELAGMANAATGKTGSATDRAGKGLGSELKDTGVGGNGKALEGIAGGVGTTGRGSGNTGYGTGGLGKHTGSIITPGGTGEVISGTIDREAIRRVILANIKTIRACYERELNRKPDLFGKLVLSWDIGEQGRVVGTRVKSNELGSQAVADCILANLKTWRFPEPPTNQVVEIEAYPFLFSN
jgi:predicted component of type VI protein secretion system